MYYVSKFTNTNHAEPLSLKTILKATMRDLEYLVDDPLPFRCLHQAHELAARLALASDNPESLDYGVVYQKSLSPVHPRYSVSLSTIGVLIHGHYDEHDKVNEYSVIPQKANVVQTGDATIACESFSKACRLAYNVANV